MRKFLRLIADFCRLAGKKLDRLATPRDYQDNIARRDKLILEIYAKLDAGSTLEEAIANPRASQHGERVLEYPFVYQLLKQHEPREILDIGCVLNNAVIDPFITPHCDISFLNPAVEPLLRTRATYFKSDLASFKSPRKFSLITCLSTLEHIGFDNTRYGALDARDQGWDWNQSVQTFVNSLHSIQKLLTSGGTAWISCPYGKQEFVRYPRKNGPRVWQVINSLHLSAITVDQLLSARIKLYRLTDGGWICANAKDSFSHFGSVGCGAAGLIIIQLQGGKARHL